MWMAPTTRYVIKYFSLYSVYVQCEVFAILTLWMAPTDSISDQRMAHGVPSWLFGGLGGGKDDRRGHDKKGKHGGSHHKVKHKHRGGHHQEGKGKGKGKGKGTGRNTKGETGDGGRRMQRCKSDTSDSATRSRGALGGTMGGVGGKGEDGGARVNADEDGDEGEEEEEEEEATWQSGLGRAIRGQVRKERAFGETVFASSRALVCACVCACVCVRRRHPRTA